MSQLNNARIGGYGYRFSKDDVNYDKLRNACIDGWMRNLQ
jgi:hypothetical protein